MMEKITYIRDKNTLLYKAHRFSVTNNVRNEIDPVYRRRLHDKTEIRYTINKDRTKGKPYMPRKFPKGNWKILAVEWWKELYGVINFDRNEYGIVRVRTDAHQPVELWALDKDGGYDHGTGELVEDYGYLFHFAPASKTTLGCGRVETQEACVEFAKLIEDNLEGGKIDLEVL